MIKIENVEVTGWESAVRGMRNPMNSWGRGDSEWDDSYFEFVIGEKDHELMMQLAKAGSVHAKYRRMIVVHIDILAPLYWWKEFDTYKIGTVSNSCSTMHKIHSKKFVIDDFSHEHLLGLGVTPDHLEEDPYDVFDIVIQCLNVMRELYLETGEKVYWWQMIQLLPSSYNQRRTIMLNYEVLFNIYIHRKDHKLDEWRNFCRWIETLPYSEIITLKED